MAQIFHPSTNTISKLSIAAVVVLLPLLGVAGYAYQLTYGLNLNIPLEQPVQFSHKHHVQDDGIDCYFLADSVAPGAGCTNWAVAESLRPYDLQVNAAMLPAWCGLFRDRSRRAASFARRH